MRLIDCDSAEAYLRMEGRIGPREAVRVRRLSGGVSNEVLLVERPEHPEQAFVLKQARPQLRVADPWFCSIERIWREVDTLRACDAALQPSSVVTAAHGEWSVLVPEVLFEDRDNYLFAMTAAPPHEVWKQRLLSGRVERSLAAACGELLAALHAGTWGDTAVAERLGDRSFFDDLRIDPYYRRVAQVHTDLQTPVAVLIHSLGEHCRCLVHGDFSPKNLLVYTGEGLAARGLMLVDFEVGHYGDPAFDLGFFLTHLVLKAFWSGPRFDEYFALSEVFWVTYRETLRRAIPPEELDSLSARTVRHFAACTLARLDGKSKVEYLTDEPLRATIRQQARELLLDPPPTWEEVEAQLKSTGRRATG
jgi:aminoglycoside phosphotransferase (APT) family kinase protein